MQRNQNFMEGQHPPMDGPPIGMKPVFDGRTSREYKPRKFLDYGGPLMNYMYNRTYTQSSSGRVLYFHPPHPAYDQWMMAPQGYKGNPSNAIATKLAHVSKNTEKSPVNVIAWMPAGRRLVCGSAKGEFTLWDGKGFHFVTIQQAHDDPIRTMQWNHRGKYLVSADQAGCIKYWETTMNNIQKIDGHDAAIRDCSFCPTDIKFVSCSDDSTMKIWDFLRCKTEYQLFGHGSDVTCCEWHPTNSIIASGSKDYSVRLWDANSCKNVAILEGHKNMISRVKWNKNGNWLLTGARDQLLKLYDIRYMKDFATFRGHDNAVMCLEWHPVHETLFASAGYDGKLLFWMVGHGEKEGPSASVPQAHNATIWDLDWHPVGHVLSTASKDGNTKFWKRNPSSDNMTDNNQIHMLPSSVRDREIRKREEREA